MHTLRMTTIIFMLFSLSSCSWVSRDFYYKNSETPEGWTTEFRPGVSDTKSAGNPDTVMFKLDNVNFDLKLELNFQNVISVGPLLFPIIPTPWPYDGNLILTLHIQPQDDITLFINNILITDKSTKEIFAPRSVQISASTYHKTHKKVPQEIIISEFSKIFIFFPNKSTKSENLYLNLGTHSIDNKPFTLPSLNLTKTKGTWHFEQFTL